VELKILIWVRYLLKSDDIFNGIDWKSTWAFYTGDNKNKVFYCYKTKSNSWCEILIWKFTFRFTIKRFKKWFLLYTNKWKLLKITHDYECDSGRWDIYKTFLNWKEVK
jgi:hypothetical protein